MAKQKGIVKLNGTIGDISFYKGKNGYLAREKGGIEASRIATDPAFQRTRENGAEFGRAGSAGKLLRTAIKPALKHTADGSVTARLTKEMLRVVKADGVNPRGERNVLDGEVELLNGFEFNVNGNLAATLAVPFQAAIDRVSGLASVTIPGFIPQESLAVPDGATHFKFISAGAEINFQTKEYQYVEAAGELNAINAQALEETVLDSQLTAAGELPMFLVFGIEFYQVVNGFNYPIKNGSFNCLSMVAVDGGA